MKNVLCFLMLFLTSCNTYFDRYGDLANKYYTLKFDSHYAVLTVISGMVGMADNQYFYPQKFEIYLPKKIKGISAFGETYIFEYDNKQVIAIDPGYQNYNKRPKNWIIKNAEEVDLNEIADYWKNKKYSDKIFETPDKNRVTKIYTNGEVKICLFNVKPENFNSDLALIKFFAYLD